MRRIAERWIGTLVRPIGQTVLRVRAFIQQRRNVLRRVHALFWWQGGNRGVLGDAHRLGRRRHRLEWRDVRILRVIVLGIRTGFRIALGKCQLIGKRTRRPLFHRLFDGRRWLEDRPHGAEGDEADDHEGKDQLFDRGSPIFSAATRRGKGGNSVSLPLLCGLVKLNFP